MLKFMIGDFVFLRIMVKNEIESLVLIIEGRVKTRKVFNQLA